MVSLPRFVRRTRPLLERLAERTRVFWRGRAQAYDTPRGPRPEDRRGPFPEDRRQARLHDRRIGGTRRRDASMEENVKVILRKVNSTDQRLKNLESGKNNLQDNLRKWMCEGVISVLVCNNKMTENYSQLKEYLKQLMDNTDEVPEAVLSVLGPW